MSVVNKKRTGYDIASLIGTDTNKDDPDIKPEVTSAKDTNDQQSDPGKSHAIKYPEKPKYFVAVVVVVLV